MRTTAIVPIFNEEKTIKNVLSTLNNSELIDKIVVVNDASTDNSLEIIKSFISKKIRIISLKRNLGKSGAVKVATKNLKTDILFFCDGDLHNFKPEHIEQILKPLKDGRIAMSAGLRDYGRLRNFFDKNFTPLITGERALPYSVFKKTTKNSLMKGYGLELVLNDYCKRNNIPIYKKVMKGLKNPLKTKKWKNGAYYLAKEACQIVFVIVILRLKMIIKD